MCAAHFPQRLYSGARWQSIQNRLQPLDYERWFTGTFAGLLSTTGDSGQDMEVISKMLPQDGLDAAVEGLMQHLDSSSQSSRGLEILCMSAIAM